jgi:hypothetical protein
MGEACSAYEKGRVVKALVKAGINLAVLNLRSF